MLTGDDDILREAESWARAGRGVAIATVIETWGSAPRPVGSHLVVDEEGAFQVLMGGDRVARGCVHGPTVLVLYPRHMNRAEQA